MHTVEHSDRFVITLPNGQFMAVAKNGLSPATLAEMRGAALPGMADGGDDKDAEIKRLEAEIDALAQASEPDAGYADYKARVDAADAGDVRDARYGVNDDRDAGTLAEGIGNLGVFSLPPPGPPMGAAPDVGGVDPGAIRTLLTHQPSEAQVALAEASDAGRVSALGNAPQNVAPNSSPVTETPVGSMVAGARPGFTAEQERLLIGAVPQIAASPAVPEPIAPVAPEAPAGALSDALDVYRQAFAKATQGGGGGEAPQVAKQRMEPFVAPQGMVDAAAAAQNAAIDLGRLDSEAAKAEAAMRLDHERQAADLNAKMEAERADEYRRQQELFSDVYSGKIDPNRLWGRMDTGQKALALVGLVLGGIGAGNTGVNSAVGVLDRMIDRDVDAQAKDLDRKRTLYGEYLRMGYQREQARQMTKASLLNAHAAQLQRLAAQSGAPRAIASADAVAAEMRMKAESWLQQAQDAHMGRQVQMMGLEQQRQIANQQAAIEAEKARLSAQVKIANALKPDPKIEALMHTLPDGRVIVASTPESKGRIEKAQTEHETFVRGIQMLKQMRAANPGGNFLPGWMAFMGFNSAEQSKIGDDLAAAVRLAYLKAQGAGAYDKGSGELSKQIIGSPSDVFGTSDESFFKKMDNLVNLANSDFYSTVTAGSRGGHVFRPPTVRVIGQVQ